MGLLPVTAIVLQQKDTEHASGKGVNSLSCSTYCRTEQNAGKQLLIHLVKWEKIGYWNGQSIFLRVVNK